MAQTATLIATSVTASNRNDPAATGSEPQTSAMPVVAAAGTSAAATITPTSAVGPFVVIENAAAPPAASATATDTAVGATRIPTSSSAVTPSPVGANPTSLSRKLNAVAPTMATNSPATW